MSLAATQLEDFRRAGHLTVAGVFRPEEMDSAIADIERWGEEFLADLPPDRRRWYIDGNVQAREVLRKLDNPHYHRPVVQRLARDPRLTGLVECLIGAGLSVCFSQIFFKAPEGGGPKPAHQDNFYFGPRDPEALVTAWIALDDATAENGCMSFGEGTHRGPVMAHVAPPGEPFNLQIPAEMVARTAMTLAPVPKGGVSFHHGGVFHQSGANHSKRWRRACALHYVRNDNAFIHPALKYDETVFVRVS
jgi:ectoine hydroxylase-related dioxygenase (phytanoyl-CoA dioxygenase family)